MAVSNDYIKSREEALRRSALKLTRQQEQAIIDAYVKAGQQLADEIRKGSGKVTDRMKQQYLKNLNGEVARLIREYGIKSASNPLEEELKIINRLLGKDAISEIGFDKLSKQLIKGISNDSVKQIINGGIYKDNRGLSSRIWKSTNQAGQTIQDVIAAARARGMGSADLAKLLEEFVNPSARKLWTTDKIREVLGDGYASWNKNLEYNALRLARTTLSHSATQSMKESGRLNPYNKKFQWHSAHSAGRTCAECAEMDGEIFTANDLPYDHPNGLCWVTHYYDKSLDDIADELAEWVKGGDNPELDSWYKELNKPFTGSTNNNPKFVKGSSELEE